MSESSCCGGTKSSTPTGDDVHACFGYEGYRYRNAKLGRWIDAVARILRDPALLAAVRSAAASREGTP